VLVEGEFSSTYKNRQKAFSLNNFLETGPENKMIVIGDGDVVANQLKGGKPLELGYDQWTNAYYGNKEFLINCMNYLLEDNGLINIRNKQVKIPLLDTNRVNLERNYWQFLNVGLPALFLVIFGGVFQWVRSRKFT
jgi:gliding-associated putative ABC transporter substrate-binding component GldG